MAEEEKEKNRETIEEFLARDGTITICKPKKESLLVSTANTTKHFGSAFPAISGKSRRPGRRVTWSPNRK